jgi:CBS domain-containing protein
MKLVDVLIPTGMAHPGMTVGAAFRECVTHDVPGIPYCDDNGRVTGRISIRHTLKKTCIPDYMIKAAHFLGDRIESATIPASMAKEVLDMPVEPFVLENINTITPDSPAMKALAIMERQGTGYIFLIDQGRYQGIVTRMGIAELMLRYLDE